LPTQQEREALQKHYYYLLISRAKKVAISYVSNDDVIASRFLENLAIQKPEITDMKVYSDILFNRGVLNNLHTKEIVAPYDFASNKLSATSLKSFLTCKRQFYYKYISKIKSHEIAKELPQEYEIGNILHNALKKLYLKDRSFSDIDTLKKSFEYILDDLNEANPLVRYQIKLWKKRLQAFYLNEIERFNLGYKVHSCEESLTCKHNGLTLYGTIDRLDSFENSFEVIDYKSGNYKLYNAKNFQDATDFQLEFYYLFASNLGVVKECSFYDLQSGKLVSESFLQEKLELLKSHLDELESTKEFNFQLCEDFNSCRYCEYKILCDRE
jgi:RecB family exonuclease